MCNWKYADVLEAVNGRPAGDWNGPCSFSSIVTDTREPVFGSLFVPLVGEKFNGHRFVSQALELGAGGALWSESEIPEELVGCPLIRVNDTLDAYQALAQWNRRRLGVAVVAVTGSVGKTTTKDLICTLLRAKYSVYSTAMNYNNDVGVAKTLLELSPNHEVAVVELGMRGPGQIRRLAKLLDAKVGIITTIGESHLQLLGSREAIADAKAELLDEMSSESVAVLPLDSPFYERLRAHSRGRVVTFSQFESSGADWTCQCHRDKLVEHQGHFFCGSQVTISGPLGTHILEYSLPGRHNAVNLVSALAVAAYFGIKPEDVSTVLRGFRPTGNRTQIDRLANGMVVIDDSYNAAPTSVRAVFETLSGIFAKPSAASGRLVAVLGDMLELGADEVQMHCEVGQLCHQYGVDLLVAVGQLSQHLAQAAEKAGVGEVHWVADKDAAIKLLRTLLLPNDWVLVKASRAIGLDRVAAELRNTETSD